MNRKLAQVKYQEAVTMAYELQAAQAMANQREIATMVVWILIGMIVGGIGYVFVISGKGFM